MFRLTENITREMGEEIEREHMKVSEKHRV